jgi:transcription termination factor Rho
LTVAVLLTSTISELLTPIGKTSREALISKEPKKFKICVNSRCNRFYQNKWNDNPEKGIIVVLYISERPEIKKFRTIRPNSILLTRF